MSEEGLMGSLSSRLGKHSEVIFLALGFGLSSSLLVIINKWALKKFPYGATLTALQFFVSAMVAKMIGVVGLSKVDALESEKVIGFMPAVCMFYISVATNLKLLEIANVDTFIVVRSCVPLFTMALEMVAFKTAFPGLKTLGTLLLIIFGACGYVATDEGFRWEAVWYALIYLCAFTIDQVLIKKIVMDVKLQPWGLVYYNNLLALVLMPAGMYVTGEWGKLSYQLESQNLLGQISSFETAFPVLLSCAFGISISFFGLNTRKALTATAFTVLGVVCKFLTVFVNTIAWDSHASPIGIFFVCICIAGGILFQRVQGAAVVTPSDPSKQQENPPSEKSVPPLPPGGSASMRSTTPAIPPAN
eukprot:TRINITY_DN1371_c1_g4_i1.p1 TRINITY_DN1371_c1_g4~~TRINITY_DN1371_c1_g4_i1.p1  ORF type:complete len:379 (+),score=77.19 TRINITY_DN1371_c1_g4_i1:59-1138(+)